MISYSSMLEKEDLQKIKEIIDDSAQVNNRVMQDFVRHEVRKVKEEIIDGVAQLLDTSIHPQLDDHEARLTKLEHQLAAA